MTDIWEYAASEGLIPFGVKMYFRSLLGLLGWLGYTFAPGRRGGRKLLILIATALLCKLLGSGISVLFCCLTHAPIESSHIFARSLFGEGLTGIVDLE